MPLTHGPPPSRSEAGWEDVGTGTHSEKRNTRCGGVALGRVYVVGRASGLSLRLCRLRSLPLVGASGAHVALALLHGHTSRHIPFSATDGTDHCLQGRLAGPVRFLAMPPKAPVVRVQPPHGLVALPVLATTHFNTPWLRPQPTNRLFPRAAAGPPDRNGASGRRHACGSWSSECPKATAPRQRRQRPPVSP